jgi:hypothetical protein
VIGEASDGSRIGEASDGSRIGEVERRSLKDDPDQPLYSLGDIRGYAASQDISSYNSNCGWVKSGLTGNTVLDGTSPCNEGYRPSIKGVISKINCSQYQCGGGTAIFLRPNHATVECANVYPVPDGNTEGCSSPKERLRTIAAGDSSGYCVEWRYVTKDQQYVMVRDRHFRNSQDSRLFIPISALDPDTTPVATLRHPRSRIMHAVPLIRRCAMAAAVMAVAIGVEPAGAMPDIAPERAHAAAAITYRFQKPPVVLFARLPGPVFHVVFRLHHKLVRNHLGVRATVSLNRTGDPSRPTNFRQPRACYLQELEVGPDDAVLEHPRTGAKVTVTLRVKAPVAQTLTADVRLRRVSAHTFDAPDGDGTFAPAGC